MIDPRRVFAMIATCALVACALAGALSLLDGQWALWAPFVVLCAAFGATSIVAAGLLHLQLARSRGPAREQRLDALVDELLETLWRLSPEERTAVVRSLAQRLIRCGVTAEQAEAAIRELGRRLQVGRGEPF